MKKDWIPTSGAFERLLAWLDEGADSGGENYLAIRRRLASYFARKGCLGADDLADETLNRVARRLEEQGSITDASPAQYCYISARFVFLEHLRRADAKATLREPSLADASSRDPDRAAREALLDDLETCLQQLKADDRDLILEYYRGEQRVKIECRRRLAARLRVTVNALSIRACRIRDRLEACVKGRRAEHDMVSHDSSHRE